MQPLMASSGKFFAGLSSRARAGLAIGAVLVVALVLGLAFAFRSDAADLWPRAMDAGQISEVSARLTAWDIPFTVTPDNVRVEPSQKRDILMRLMTVGVPHTHIAGSAELGNDVSALTPQAILDQKKLQGLEGDLASDLRSMRGVVDARVQISPSQEGVFVDEKSSAAKASVFLTLDPSDPLAGDSVSGLQQYVAAAVPGLVPEHVEVMDQTGNLLSSPNGGNADRQLASNLQSLLDRAVGPGLTLVQAHVDTDTTSVTQREIKQQPLNATVASNVTKEHYEAKSKSYDKIKQNDNHGSDTVDKSVTTAAGATKRMSIAVVVDQSKASMVPMVKSLVAAAAGLETSRGDELTVETSTALAATGLGGVAAPAKPGQPAPETASLVPAGLANFGGALPYVVLALAILMGLAVITKPLFSMMIANAERSQVRQKQAEVADFEPARVKAALANEPPHAAAAILAALPASTTARVLEMYDPERREAITQRLSRPLSPVVRDVGAQSGGA